MLYEMCEFSWEDSQNQRHVWLISRHLMTTEKLEAFRTAGYKNMQLKYYKKVFDIDWQRPPKALKEKKESFYLSLDLPDFDL